MPKADCCPTRNGQQKRRTPTTNSTTTTKNGGARLSFSLTRKKPTAKTKKRASKKTTTKKEAAIFGSKERCDAIQLQLLRKYFDDERLKNLEFLRALRQKLGGNSPTTTKSNGSIAAAVTTTLTRMDEITLARLKRALNHQTLARLRHRIDVYLNGASPAMNASASGEDLWNYDNEDIANGPSAWPMANGKLQSPINLVLSDIATIELTTNNELQFHNYSIELNGRFFNNGRSVQFLPDECAILPEISGGMLDQHYRFLQYHYHWSQTDENGSEHALDGVLYSAELHLVHQGVDDPTKLAVLGVLLKVGDVSTKSDALSPESSVLERVRHYNAHATAPAQRLAHKLPSPLTFIRYAGSLTTPPCTENVTWTVFTEPLLLRPEQIAQLRTVENCDGKPIACNCRPLRQAYGRSMIRTISYTLLQHMNRANYHSIPSAFDLIVPQT